MLIFDGLKLILVNVWLMTAEIEQRIEQTLDHFFPKHESIKETAKSLPAEKDELVFTPQNALNVPPSYFISIGYDGEKRKCFIRLYEPKEHKIYFWYDDSDHQPYCFSHQTPEELQSNPSIIENPGFERFEVVEKYDALRDRQTKMTKIVAKDPLTIGGKPVGSIRDSIKAWEADIKYVENYIYDRRLEPGMMYQVKDGQLIAIPYKPSPETLRQVEESLGHEPEEYKQLAYEWLRLLECPVPTYRRAAIDIEVYQPVPDRIPDAHEADQPVIAVSIVGSDGERRVLLLKRPGIEEGNAKLPDRTKLEYYDDERQLFRAIFKVLLDYPIIATFNGDDFDLRYLWNRAQRAELGFSRNEIPIEMGRDVAFLKYGVHIDLYKFFFNRSIQVYAFGQKYRENTLDELGEALVAMPKLEIGASVSQLSYTELAAYCLRDAEIVMVLTCFEDDLVMKLMTALSRISYMTIDDVSRQGVSNWIRSIMFCHHRKRNYLIPRSDEIVELKGGTVTEAIIRGKKYKGAIVVEPEPGVHFNVSVLDFASLYPSIIKVWNLGYETVRCPHEDERCRSNLVPGTPHWVCKRKRALESMLIGSLRDLRVRWYKLKSKDRSLPKTLQNWYKVVSDALKVVLNACFTADTEVLTPKGRRRISELNVGDEIYTLNERTGFVEVKPIVECQHFLYNGPLVEVHSRHVDWKVTANHDLYLGIRTTINGDSAIKFRKSKALCEAQQAGRRYLFRHPALKADTDGGTFEHVNLLNYASHKKELPTRPNQELDRRFLFGSRFNCDSATGFEGSGPARYYRSTRAITDLAPEKFEVPRKSDREVLKFLDYASQFPRSLEARALFELIGLYVAKGATQAPIRKREKLTRITIRPRGRILNRDRIASTIRNLGLKPRVTRNGVSFSSQIVAEFLRKECGSKSEEKRLPGFVFSAPFELRRMLFEVLMQSGGDIRRGVYSTISEKLAEDFHHLAFTLGIEALIRTESLNNGNRIFRVKLFGRGHRVICGSNFTITPVTGLHVYCVTAQDNHIIYAGRDGKFGWIGQSYGVFGAETFALYCPPVAEATAAIGRYAITETIKKAQSLGVKVFYGDTDSIFLGSENPELLHQLIEWSKSNLSMELEIDKNYRYLALSSRKKNYLGVYPDGSVDIKGLTGKKRHIPQFLHAAFYEMIEILRGVQSPEEFEKARASIAEIVRSCYLKLRNREYPLEQLAFSVMISRPPDRYTKTTPQHVKAASLLVKRGVEVKAGDLISFVKVLSEPGVKPVQLASYEEIDIEKYLEYLRSTFEQVLDALGLEFEELIGLKKLESFFDTQSC